MGYAQLQLILTAQNFKHLKLLIQVVSKPVKTRQAIDYLNIQAKHTLGPGFDGLNILKAFSSFISSIIIRLNRNMIA